MASFRELRPKKRLATAGRLGLRGPRRPVALLTAAVALAAVALLLLAQLAGRPERQGNPSTSAPVFLANALGTPQASAPLVRKPRPGVRVRLRPAGYEVARNGRSFSLASTEAGTDWRHFRNGSTRRTGFGSETVLVDSTKTEQFLTVDRRQGRKTWTWRLATDGLVPAVRGDGAVGFSARGRDANLSILPPRILDGAGREVTPAGARWRLARGEDGWVLALDVDDAALPLPYVIDPASNYPTPLNLRNTASAVTGSWRMDGSTGTLDIVTDTIPGRNVTGYFQFNPGASNSAAGTPGAATGRGWIVEPVGGASGFPAGTWTFTVQTDIPNATLTAGAANLAIGIWKGTVSGSTFTPTATIMAVTDDPAAQNIRTATTPVTTNVAYSLGQITLGATETLYVEIWRNQTVGIDTNTAARRQLDLYVNDGVTKIAHPAADDTAPTSTYSLVSQSPAGSTFRSGTTIYYRGTGGGSGGSFQVRNTVADGGSGPASSTTQDTLSSGGWTHTASTVSTPAGGPYDSNTLTWTEGSTSSPTEGVFGTDAAGNVSTTTTFTMTNDSGAPPAPATTFPAASGSYRASTWNAGCGTNGFCGSAAADGGSGLRDVAISIRRDTGGNYWDGSGFNSGTEVFQTATGTSTWEYTFPASNFPADGTYTVRVRSTDNVNNTATSSSYQFTYDNTAPTAPSSLATNPASPANNNDPRVTGTAEAGSTVDLYATADCTGGVAATGTAATFGGAGFNPADVSDNTTTSYTAKATDAAGNVSGCSSSISYVEDSAAPTAPTITSTNPASPANNNDPRVIGTAEAGSTVDLYATADCTGGIAGTGTAAAFGGAGLDPADVSDNTTTSYTAKATDAAGNTSGCSSPVSYVEDSAAPIAPTGLATTPASPANNNDPRITGTAEAGSTVNLYATADCTGGVVASGSAATFGGAGFDPADVADNTTTSYTAKATDAAGNVSGCSSAVSYVEDSAAPSAPTGLGSTPASPANNNDPRITGTAEAGSTVSLYATADCTGGVVASGSAATFGGAGFDPADVADNTTTSYTARATDAAGNVSGCSSAFSYVEDSAAPSAPSALGTSPTSPANNNDPKVTGTAEAGSTVNVYATADCTGGIAGSGSAATFGGAGVDTTNVADDSTTSYTARAVDAAGNVSLCSSAVSYVEDSTAPGAPSGLATSPASPANDNDPELTGSAEAGSTVRIYSTSDCPGGALATGTAALFGGAGISANVANDTSTTFKATATDAAGNPSVCSSGVAYVEDSTAPSAPTGLATSPASPANDNDPELTGSAEAGSTVRLYTTADCSGGAAATGTAALFGGAGISVNVANDSSTTYKATATDAAGNPSSCSSGVTYVEDSTAPAAPNTLSSSPGSPANDNDPEITGSAEGSSTVRLYTTSDCSGAPVASGLAGAFATPGFSVNVPNDSSTTYKATATDAANNTSVCSAGFTYVEDSTAPSAPSGLATSPASPANDNDPELTGSAEAGSTVRIYSTSDCSGAPLASGSAATFGGAGISANVANDTSTTFKATATDAAGNPSACSSGVAYVEDSTAPSAPTGLATSPASPANDNDPELTGSAEAGSTVRLYTTSDCSGGAAATGTAALFGGAGISVNVANDSSTTYRATATDAANNTSVCSAGVAYVEDSTAPSAPTGLATSPASPASDNDPEVTGSAEAGSTVRIYSTSDCTAAPLATGTAATFGGAGISVNVANDSSSTFKATATDAAGNASTCSSGVAYVEDSTAPSAPSGLATSPASPANDNDPEVTGSAEAGSTVRLYTTADCSGAALATGTAATFGGAGISVNVANDSSSTFKATATDTAGNTSSCSSGVAYVEDSTAPSAPSGLASSPASPANDNDPELTGSAEAGSTVRLYTTSDCSGAAIATGTAAAFGGAGLSVNVANDSTTTYKATATDAAGNASSCSSGLTYVEDSTAPSAPTGLATSPASPANDNDPEVTGSAEAGSTVRLYSTSDCSGAALATGTAAVFGGAGIGVNVASDSSSTLKATASDAAGNTSSCSSGVAYIEDSTAPAAPTIAASSPASPANDNDPELSGSAEAGSTVRIYTNGTCTSAVAASGTAAAFAGAGLSVNVANDSTTSFHATATDAAGNASGCSVTPLAYAEDSTAPSAPTGLATSPASPANDNDPEVSGSAEAGSTVRLYTTSDCSGAAGATGTAAAFGGAGVTINVANDSSSTFKATATDTAGNMSACSSGVGYVEDSTAPAAPSTLGSSPGSPANDNDPEITGSAEGGSTVRLYATSDCSGAPLASGGSGAFATPGFTVNVANDSSTTYKATATDAAGNLSSCSSGYTYVEDSIAPGAPSGLASSPASPANDNDPEITGSAEAGSTVRLYPTSDCSGAELATGTAAAFGGAGISVNVANNSSSTFKATARDAAGNTSSCSTGVAYVEDSTAPAAPSGLSTSPASPANSNSPRVKGSAEAGSTVNLYTTSDCSGAPTGSGDAASFDTPGIAQTVADDSSTTWYTTATDAAGNASPCSSGVTYVEDSTAPTTPSGLATSPASPANDNDPEVSGTTDAGTTVRIYTTSDCSGAPLASGTAATFNGAGISVNVANDSSSTFKATATDAAGNASACSTGVAYVEDSTAPSAPSGLATSPVSPANDNDPEVSGSAEAGSTVRIYTTSDCSGAATATGTAAAFGGAGLTVNVANDSSSTFKATATDATGNASACSTGVAYVEDSTAPSAPTGLATSPASPANDNDPEVSGSAEAGSTVRVYTTSDCSGAAVATGTAAAFGGGGLSVNVANDSSSTFKATATDAAGNASACSTGVAYVEDSTAPSAPSVLNSSPGSPANENDPEITGSAEAGSTVRVYTTSDCSGAAVATGAAAAFAAPGFTVNVVNDSSTTYKATATDAAGNLSSCSSGYTYVEDSTTPNAPSGLATSPASPANENDPEVTGSAEAGTTVRVYTTNDCSGAPAATGTAAAFGGAGLSVNVANDSSTTFKATAADDAGNTSACSTGVAYVEDSATPSSVVSFPAAGGSYNTASWNDFSGTASDPGGSGVQRVELSIRRDSSGLYWDGSSFTSGSEDWRTATSTASWTYTFPVSNFPADGDYTLRVRAVDNAGNTQSPSTHTFTVDRGAPNTTLDSGPDDPSNDPNPSFTFSASEGGVTYECRLDGGAWGSCTSPKSYTGLTEASYTFDVRATDGAGNTDPTPASRTWTLDRTDPAAAFSFPAAGGFYNAAGWNDFSGTASDSGGAGLLRVELSIQRVSTGNYWDGAGFASGSELWQTASGTAAWSLAFAAGNFPSDGDYAVRVRAIDNANNTQAPVSRSFNVDTVPPETTIDSGPSGPTANVNASFAFSADQGGSTFECRLDGGSWSACGSPKSYTSLSQGAHTFDVRATDPGNNTDSSPAARAWTVDTVPPTATMDNPGAYVRGTVALTSSTSDSGGTGIASVVYEKSPAGAGTWSGVAASWDTTASADGLYDLHVVATDNAGNTTTSAAVTNVRVDNTAPSVTMNSPGPAVSGTVSLSSTNDDFGGSGIDTVQFQYKPSSGSTWVNTAAGWDTTALSDGDYDLRAIVADRAGNSTTSAAVTTTVDNTNPTIVFSAPPPGGFVNAAAADPFTLVAAANDAGTGVASVEFWACDNASTGCSSGNWTSLGTDATSPYEASWNLPAADGNRALRARATDLAGRQATTVTDVTIDRAVPDTTLLTNPGNPSNDATPTFTFSSNEGGATFECRVDGGSWTSCSSPHTTGSLADGTRTFDVRATDLAGNVDATVATWTWLVDTTLPIATMDDPGANLRLAVNLTSSQSDPGGAASSGIATVEYQYSVANANTWVGTPTPWDTQAVADGLYDLRVVVTDNAGNVRESTPVEDRRVDNTAPSTSHDDPGANMRQTVTLTGQADDTGGSGVQQVEFQISPTGAGSWTALGLAVAAPYQVSFITSSYADGLYDFRTVATDLAGNMTEGTPVVSRRIDNTAPIAIMNDPGANLRGTVNLTSTADDPGGSGVASVVYEYAQAGGGAWQGASASWATASVPDDMYDLHVVVRDAAGNETISATVASRRVDNTAPTTGDNAPAGWQASAVTVTLSASDGSGSGVSNTQYAVDGGAWVSGNSVSISSDGIHTISYFSTDVVGNVESPRAATVMIDTTPPDPGANDPGNYLRGTVTLSANPTGSGAPVTEVEFQYSPAGAGTWTSIGTDNTGPGPYSVDFDTTGPGDGSFDLRFIVREDTVPPRETTVDMASKIIDNTAPTASVGSPLNGAVVSGNVTIGVTASDANPITNVEFFVRGSSVGSSSSAPFQHVWNSASAGDGPASLHVVVNDIAGNSTTSAAINVTADNFAPAVTLSSPGPAISGTTSLSAAADGDTVQVNFERRPAGSGGGWSSIGADVAPPWSADFVTTAVPDGDYELRATATDAGGNTGISGVATTRVDNTLPSGSVTQPGGGATVGGSSVALAATAGDGAGGSGVASVTWQYRQTAVGGAYADAATDTSGPYAATWDVTSLASAAYDVRVAITDVAGNAFETLPIQIDVDSTAPTVTLNDPGAQVSGTISLGAVTVGDATTVTFGISPAGAASWTAIGTDGSAPWTTNFDTTTRNDGVYDFRAIVSDAVGNTSVHVRAGVRIDNFMPVVIASAPAHGSIVVSANQIVLTVSEDIASLSGLDLDGSAPAAPVVSGATATFNTGPLADGPHTLSGTVSDGAGNSSGFSVSFVIGVPTPPPAEAGLPVTPIGLVPAPASFRGVIEDDGTLTLAWTPAKDAAGRSLATILFVDSVALQSIASGETSVNLGPFDAADMRVFTIASVDVTGRVSPQSARLRSTSMLAGKPLADVEAALINRGFDLGEVRGSGVVVVKPAKPLMAELGSRIDVELGQPDAPQTKLVFSVVGTKRFSWSVRKDIGVRTKVTRASQITVALVSPSGARLYRWRFRIKAGTSIVRLTMPPQVRRPGVYRLVFTAASARDTVKRTIVVEIVGKRAKPSKKPVDVVLAGNSGAKDDIAVDLTGDGLRVLAAAGSDDAFGLTGNAARNVQVIVVDVDRFGVGLVRDLRIVFPMVKIIALSNDPRRLAQSMRAGATVAVPRSTPPKDLARLIAQLARRR